MRRSPPYRRLSRAARDAEVRRAYEAHMAQQRAGVSDAAIDAALIEHDRRRAEGTLPPAAPIPDWLRCPELDD